MRNVGSFHKDTASQQSLLFQRLGCRFGQSRFFLNQFCTPIYHQLEAATGCKEKPLKYHDRIGVNGSSVGGPSMFLFYKIGGLNAMHSADRMLSKNEENLPSCEISFIFKVGQGFGGLIVHSLSACLEITVCVGISVPPEEALINVFLGFINCIPEDVKGTVEDLCSCLLFEQGKGSILS